MKHHLKEILWRMTGLLRSRVIICMIGLKVMSSQPEIGQWVVAICGMAMGVSAVDAFRGRDNGRAVGSSIDRDSR